MSSAVINKDTVIKTGNKTPAKKPEVKKEAPKAEKAKVTKVLNGATFRKMLLGGASLLEQQRKYVDSLNVFPVPDGDTGINMCLTFKSSIKEIEAVPNNNIDAIAEALNKGALKGARGNSGVILSQILKGFSTVVAASPDKLDTKQFAKALVEAQMVAYKAVTKPKEGTMLTVIRVMAEEATKLARKYSDFETFMKELIVAGEDILQQTPDMLEVLKKAGVVDAGGRGIIVIFEGMNKALLGEEIKAVAEELVETNESPDVHIDFDALEDIEFAYCTEFMVVNLNKKTTMSDIDKLRDNLMTLGDSVLCIGDLTMVKVHVHTNTPHMAMGYALELGELDNIKIENMLAQSRAMREQMEKNREQKPYAIVAVCAGEGLSAIFKDITVDRIISGGQTMNPSASDIAKACERVPSNNVYVLPNNKNIILAAEQAKALTTKNLFVIPTVNIPQGITSVLTLNPDDTIDTNVKNMKEAIKGVKSGSITHAVRDTSINGLEIKEGDIIGLDDSNILTNTKTVNEAVASLVGKLTNGTTVSVTLFYGEDVKEEEAEKLQKELSKKYGDYDINILYGGQPVYYYLISVE